MLEILLLVYLCKRIGIGLRAKGHRAGWYQFFVVLAWLGGEFFGGFALTIMLAIVDPAATPHRGALYLGSLVSAVFAVWCVFWIARMQPDLRAEWNAEVTGESGVLTRLPYVAESGNPYQAPISDQP